METPEIMAYKEKLEKEYLDLLSYRKPLLKQIELEEKKLSAEGLAKVKEEFNKDKEIARLLKEINSLRLKIKELEGGSKPNGKIDFSMLKKQVDEILAFGNKAKMDLVESLELRNQAIKQSAEDEKKQKEAKSVGEKALEEMAENIKAANQELAEAKLEKGNFVKNLEKTAEELRIKRTELENKEIEIAGGIEQYNKLKAGYQNEKDDLAKEKRAMEEANKFTKEKEKEYKAKIGELDEKIKKNNVIGENLDLELGRIKSKSVAIAGKEREIALREEAVNQTLKTFEDREKSIESNRKHLESQQATLKLAFEEIKKREAKLLNANKFGQ